MANTKSAIKRIRSSNRKRQYNLRYRSQARTYIKRTRALLEAGEIEQAKAAADLAVKTLDKAASKGVVHPNNAARRKSRLMRQLAAAEKAD
ncbi:MAG: 30S ribosomal protein S20 [Chloroflexota bacterium]